MNETGHMLVARIAWDNMTPAARSAMQTLTADPNNPVTGKSTTSEDNDTFSAATWLDDIRPVNAGLHFVNTELNSNGALAAGPSSVSTIESNIQILKNSNSTQDQKAEALRVIMHLDGDLHQPLHDSDNNDRGGNEVSLNWQSSNPKDNNLHAFWDAGGGQWGYIARPLTAQGQQQLTQMAAQDENQYKLSDYQSQSSDLNPADWAQEGWQMAKTDCYDGVTAGQAPSAAYTQQAQKDMNYEATLGGYRLANLLNGVFAKAGT